MENVGIVWEEWRQSRDRMGKSETEWGRLRQKGRLKQKGREGESRGEGGERRSVKGLRKGWKECWRWRLRGMWRQVEGEWQTEEGLYAEKGVSGEGMGSVQETEANGGQVKGEWGRVEGKCGYRRSSRVMGKMLGGMGRVGESKKVGVNGESRARENVGRGGVSREWEGSGEGGGGMRRARGIVKEEQWE